MKQLKILFLVLIGVLVSTTFTSCGSDDEPNMPSEDELYQQWLEDATAQYDVVKDGMAYYIQEGSARLMSVNPAISGAVTIPSEVYYEGTGKSYPVTFVEFSPTPEYSNVTALTIPSSVEDCRVIYPNHIKTLSIPSSVEYLEITCCEELATVNLSEGLDNFGISDCPKISTVKIPESVTQFRFQKLNIKEATVPSTVEAIQFRECEQLEVVHNLENSLITALSSRAFFNCKSLKEITLPKTLRYIYYVCCEGCSSLSNVHILSTTPPSLRDANYGMPFTVMDNLYVPKGCKEAYKEVYPWSEFKEIIEE